MTQYSRVLVTSALPYINGVKHLGNLAGSMLPADVYVRFLRAIGQEVLFICATDEHGTPAELAAAEAGLEVAEYCRRQHDIQAEIGARFDLSFDHFGRSSSIQNHEMTQHFYRALKTNGLIAKRKTRQLFSHADNRFLPDRYVVGTCPVCGYQAARGDQCENCATVLDPVDLISPRSSLSGSSDLELRESTHLFLLQSKLVPKIEKWLEGHQDWPVLVTSIARKWIGEGVEDRSITRDLTWGIPVPEPGFEGKVFYVWFDAPIEYIAATREWAEERQGVEWESWWLDSADTQTRYVQFMAKDNVPFHTIGFPSTLIGSGEPWHLVDFIKAFNYLTYYGGKFSTSGKRGVFMDDALDILPADYWRYYLTARAPESSDASFTWEDFASVVNRDLAGSFGNLVNRTARLIERRYGTVVPAGEDEQDTDVQNELRDLIGKYEAALHALRFRKAIEALRAIWHLGNVFLERTAPWERPSNDPTVGPTLRTALNLVVEAAIVAAPIIPSSANAVLDSLGVEQHDRRWPKDVPLRRLRPGHRFATPPILFEKISPAQQMEWRGRFGS